MEPNYGKDNAANDLFNLWDRKAIKDEENPENSPTRDFFSRRPIILPHTRLRRHQEQRAAQFISSSTSSGATRPRQSLPPRASVHDVSGSNEIWHNKLTTQIWVHSRIKTLFITFFLVATTTPSEARRSSPINSFHERQRQRRQQGQGERSQIVTSPLQNVINDVNASKRIKARTEPSLSIVFLSFNRSKETKNKTTRLGFKSIVICAI